MSPRRPAITSLVAFFSPVGCEGWEKISGIYYCTCFHFLSFPLVFQFLFCACFGLLVFVCLNNVFQLFFRSPSLVSSFHFFAFCLCARSFVFFLFFFFQSRCSGSSMQQTASSTGNTECLPERAWAGPGRARPDPIPLRFARSSCCSCHPPCHPTVSRSVSGASINLLRTATIFWGHTTWN